MNPLLLIAFGAIPMAIRSRRWTCVLSVWMSFQFVATALDRCAPNHLLVCFKPEAFQVVDAKTKQNPLSALLARLDLPAGAELSETPLSQMNSRKAHLSSVASLPSMDPHRFFYLRLPEGLTPHECARRLNQHPLVEYAEPDWVGTVAQTIPSDPEFEMQWHHRNSQFPNASIQTPQAWDITQGSSNVLVAVLDTGLAELPEFQGRTVPGYNFAYTNEVTLDDNGHGTHVTALLAGNANNAMVGCGVDWHCRIMPLKVFDANNQGFYSWWVEAIDYAVSHGCKVINLSGGGVEFGRSVQKAITNAIAHGVIFVTAAGNGGATNLSFPGYLRDPITVGATDVRDERAPFSNSGPQLDLVAPGMDVVTVGLTGEAEWVRGTSFSTPLVSGVCALLASLRSDLTQADARLLLCAGAEDGVGDPADTPGFDSFYGWGRLNVFNTLLLATTHLDLIRSSPEGLTELSWRGPPNALAKMVYQVEFQSAPNVPWLVSTQWNQFRAFGDRITWEERTLEAQPAGSAGLGLYRLAVRSIP